MAAHIVTLDHLWKKEACDTARDWFETLFTKKKATLSRVLKQAIADNHGSWVRWYFTNHADKKLVARLAKLAETMTVDVLTRLLKKDPESLKRYLKAFRQIKRGTSLRDVQTSSNHEAPYKVLAYYSDIISSRAEDYMIGAASDCYFLAELCDEQVAVMSKSGVLKEKYRMQMIRVLEAYLGTAE